MFAPQAIEIIKILEKENQSRAMANGLQAKSRGCFWGVRGKKKQVKEKARGKLASLDWVATYSCITLTLTTFSIAASPSDYDEAEDYD